MREKHCGMPHLMDRRFKQEEWKKHCANRTEISLAACSVKNDESKEGMIQTPDVYTNSYVNWYPEQDKI